jgi:hypothetical protein
MSTKGSATVATIMMKRYEKGAKKIGSCYKDEKIRRAEVMSVYELALRGIIS